MGAPLANAGLVTLRGPSVVEVVDGFVALVLLVDPADPTVVEVIVVGVEAGPEVVELDAVVVVAVARAVVDDPRLEDTATVGEVLDVDPDALRPPPPQPARTAEPIASTARAAGSFRARTAITHPYQMGPSRRRRIQWT